MEVRALIFDVDGTLAETEDVHRNAFNDAFAEFDLGWSWDRDLYRELLQVTGGRERIGHYAHLLGTSVDAAAIHALKTRLYNERIGMRSVALRPGVERLIRHARERDIALAIATTTSRPNILSLLEATLGSSSSGWFASIRTGEDVTAKKPDPEVYLKALADLDVDPGACLAFEDSRNGLVAARAAGLYTIITPGIYTSEDDFDGADLIIRNLAAPWLSAEFLPYTSLAGQPVAVSRLLLEANALGWRDMPAVAGSATA